MVGRVLDRGAGGAAALEAEGDSALGFVVPGKRKRRGGRWLVEVVRGDGPEDEGARGEGRSGFGRVAAVVAARAVDGEEDLARVEAVDEARVGGAVRGEDGFAGGSGFPGRGWRRGGLKRVAGWKG